MRKPLGALLLALAALPAHAQLTLTLTPSPATLSLGGVRTLSALLTNVGAETIDLLGAGGNVTGPSALLALDDSAFLIGLPLSLASGASYAGNLTVSADVAAALGDYTLAYDVDGFGAASGDPFTGSGSAQIVVDAPSSAAPEPTSLALVTLGAALLRRRRNA